MIIFSGWKTLIGVLGASLIVIAAGSTNNTFVLALGFIAAGVCLFLFGKWSNRPQPGFNPITGEPGFFKESNSIFFIPLQWWGVAVAALGVFAMFTNNAPVLR